MCMEVNTMHEPSVRSSSSGARSFVFQTWEEWENELLRLAEERSDCDGIPIDVAWDIVSRHTIQHQEICRE